jgi:hypothetical protein
VILGSGETPILAYVLTDDRHDRPSDREVRDAMLAKIGDVKRSLGLSLAHDWRVGEWTREALAVKMEAVREIS